MFKSLTLRLGILGLLTAFALWAIWPKGQSSLPSLYSEGVSRDLDGHTAAIVDPVGTGFYPGSSVLIPGDSPGDTRVPKAVAESRSWLDAGRVPASDPSLGDLGTRALLDVRAMTAPNGAVIAGLDEKWRYVWPRDAAFAIAAFIQTDHIEEARNALGFLVSVAPSGGDWQARYLPDSSGRVPDSRGRQLDGGGWFLWSAWLLMAHSSEQDSRTADDATWQKVRASADTLSRSLTRSGLPRPSSDYWEKKESSVTLETALTVLIGLRAAAEMATRHNDRELALAWSRDAIRVRAAVEKTFGSQGYQRYVDRPGADAAIALLGPPFLPDMLSPAAIENARKALTLPNGGMKPGEAWKRDGIAWTPETLLFILHDAASGNPQRAKESLAWVQRHTTSLGSVPEKVLPNGQPASVAPLTWSSSLVVLALTARMHPLPTLPAMIE